MPHRAKSQIAWLQAPSIVHLFGDSELERFARRYGRAGCDEIRVFPWWIWPDLVVNEDYVIPWKLTPTGKYNWNRPNDDYEANVRRLKKILWRTKLYPNNPSDNRRSRIHLRFSFLDQCANKVEDPINPWKNNQGGPNGMYAGDATSVGRMKDKWLDRLWDMGVTKYDGGNELKHPADPRVIPVNNWVRDVYMNQYMAHLMDLGARKTFTFSGSEVTAHSIRGWMGDEVGRDVMCEMLHGQMLPERVPTPAELSLRFFYGLSCDGLNTRFMAIPQHRKGACTETGKYCDSAPKEHWKSVREFDGIIGGRQRFWEHLPRAIDEMQPPNSVDQNDDVNVCWRVPLKVWNVDVREKPLG